MTKERSPSCPDDATLRQLGGHTSHSLPDHVQFHDVQSHDVMPEGHALPDPLWDHVDWCPDCQERLEELTASDRKSIAHLVRHRRLPPDRLPPDRLPPDRLQEASGRESGESGLQTPDQSPLPKLDGFRIIHELGHGARSRVFLAEELSTSRQIALKRIPLEPGDSAAQRDLWMSEVRAAASIEHQNVVRLYRVEETHNCFLLVFEFVSGGTLCDWLSKPVSLVQIARFTEKVAIALHQIHQRGILHLDLKPSNILIEAPENASWEDVTPKIADFGIASLRQQQRSSIASEVLIRGTPGFMAPEQLVGDSTLLSPATDVYGLGGILYCLLTGRAPIPDSQPKRTVDQWLATTIDSPQFVDPTIDPELAQLTMRCLRQNPLERFQSAWSVAESLRSWLERHDRSRLNTRSLAGPVLTIGSASLIGLGVLLLVAGKTRSSERGTQEVGHADRTTVEVESRIPDATIPEVVSRLRHPGYNSEAEIDEQSLIRRLSELPPAFNVARAAQLVVDNQRFTDLLLEKENSDVETCLQFATLQQASGNRFHQSGLSELYSTGRYLLQDSIRLMRFARNQRPDDQQILESLIASKLAMAVIRVDKGSNTTQLVAEHVRESLNALRQAIPLVKQLKDRRQRIYWSGTILDSFRVEIWNSRFTGSTPAAQLFLSWEQESWAAFAADQGTSDLAFRHMLCEPSRSALRHVDDSEQWVLRDNRPLLHREYAYLRLAQLFFDPSEGTEGRRHPDDWKDWTATLRELHDELSLLDTNGLTIPMIIHEDLIRPLTTLCTQFRAEFQLDEAETLQRRYLKLCQCASQLFPGDSDCHLAFSEAYLQAWKNALRREQPDLAVENLERSLKCAQAAVDASPRSPRARDQVADRIKRLTRFRASRKSVSQNN